jgi:uncharacterized protein
MLQHRAPAELIGRDRLKSGRGEQEMRRLVRQLVVAALIAGVSPSGVAYGTAAMQTTLAVDAYEAGHKDVAARLFEHAARAGNRLAQYRLAMMLRRGEAHSLEANAEWRWLRRSAGAGLPQAQFELARMYDEGAGVRQSYAVAAEWYGRAALQGQPDAQARLAALQLAGLGGEADPNSAIRWFRAAAGAGHQDAQRMLSQMYEAGHGVGRDPVRAAYWRDRANTAPPKSPHLNESKLP